MSIINLIIKKRLFNNSFENISYKNFNLKEISNLIQKRFELIFKRKIIVNIEKFYFKKKFNIHTSRYFKFTVNNKKIYFEIDRLFKNLKIGT